MTINGTVLRTYGSKAVIYNRKRLVLVTGISEMELSPGNIVTVEGTYYTLHYLRHDFVDGYINAFDAEYIRPQK